MKNRFFYMKFLGLLMVIIGFSYSLTSFYNFYEYVFNEKIILENMNIFIMSIGLIIPLYLFIYGVYFYFYTDFNIVKINKFILITNIIYLIVAIVIIVFKIDYLYNHYLMIAQVFECLHQSIAYSLLGLSVMGLIGCLKYKY